MKLRLASCAVLISFVAPGIHATLWGGVAPPRPNILIILADDLGYGDIGCYGATKVRTPNIDRLAREGMRFIDAHSPASVCTPSRYNLMTGRYCWRTWAGHGTIWANDPLLIEESRMTVASLLRDAGYHTGCVGKWHLGFGKPGTAGWDDMLGLDFNGELRPGPLEVGFDYFYGMPAVGQHPNIFIENRRVVGIDPADPIRFINDPRAEFRVPYLQRPRTSPTNLQLASGQSAEYRFEDGALIITGKAVSFIEQQRGKPFFLYLCQRNVHHPLRPHERFKGTSEIGAYGDFIHELDWSVGEVLAALDRLGLAKDTLLILMSDNGGVANYSQKIERAEIKGHLLNGPLRGQKTQVYEGGHRVPFIVRWPGHVRAGAESAQLLALTDLLATFAELLERPLPDGAGEDSFSFLPVLLGGADHGTMRHHLVNDSMMGLFSIRENDWKLILGQGGGGLKELPAGTGGDFGPGGQLFNLTDDLGETRNLYDEKPEIVSKLASLLEKIRRQGRSRP